MFVDGFRLIIDTAWSMLNITILPAGAFGDHGNITFVNILVLGLGALFTAKFLRFCMGGHFNFSEDKVKPSSKMPNSYVNDFMKSGSDYYKESERVLLNTLPKR